MNLFYKWRWRLFKIPVIRDDIRACMAPHWPFREWEQPGPDFKWVTIICGKIHYLTNWS